MGDQADLRRARRTRSRATCSAAPWRVGHAGADRDAIDVFNTTLLAAHGTRHRCPQTFQGRRPRGRRPGQPVASQRLATASWRSAAPDVPPFGGAALSACRRASAHERRLRPALQGAVLDNGLLRVRVDETDRRHRRTDGRRASTGNLVGHRPGEALNDYLYLTGDDPERTCSATGRSRFSVGEKGPLVASLLVESDAPGCNELQRELRLVAGQDYVEIDQPRGQGRAAGRAATIAKEGKESVNFAFPFNVPDGEVRLDMPFGVMRPEVDQMPSACKNWFTVGRWADVANAEHGITWVTLDAPLVRWAASRPTC